MNVVRPLFVVACVFSLTPAWSAAQGDPAPAPEEKAWGALMQQLPAETSLRASKVATNPDWVGVEQRAHAFVKKYPQSQHARAAKKMAIVAALRGEDAKPVLSATTASEARAYLADRLNAVRDRLEVNITLAQIGLRHKSFASREEKLSAHEAHARDLILTFPDQPEGYGYLLAQAKAESSVQARQIAEELLAGNAPDVIKAGAKRVLARLALEGHPLALSGAEEALAAARGRELFVYTWSTDSAGVLDLVKRLSEAGDFRFIGVNLDSDQKAANAAAVTLRLPGLLLYDGGGLDGPKAQQLSLTMPSSLYFVDAEGVVKSVDAAADVLTKLNLEARTEEGRK